MRRTARQGNRAAMVKTPNVDGLGGENGAVTVMCEREENPQIRGFE